MPTKTISSFTKALSDGDFLNLAGRVMLIPTTNESNVTKLEQGRHDPHFIVLKFDLEST